MIQKRKKERDVMIVCAGEALIDMVETKNDNYNCFIPKPGGSPYNTAVAVARAGGSAGYFGAIAEDCFGKQLIGRLKADNVSLRFVKQCSEPSTLAFVQTQNGEPNYSFYVTGTSMMVFDPARALALTHELSAGSCIVFGSISLVLEPVGTMYEALMQEFASRQNRPIIAFDPNIRSHLIRNKTDYLKRFEKFVEHVDIVKVSQADLEFLMPDISFEKALEIIAGKGALLVVGTRGVHGAAAVKRDDSGRLLYCEVPGRSVQVADTVGAGDTFHGALLAVLEQKGKLTKEALLTMDNDELTEVLNFANCASALVCTRYGAEPPTLDEITALLPQ